ncbi:Ras-related protein RABA1c [Camellia lanceoleosa]|uniref:Ras-related protein RABA1c n=1 Tax=Camellia lanceoleosa TaxID=1840588 RepID=A0ACC0FXI6_9ERIC|nr:Ras-related protein RABA1c [Camellia lanceoleosa]
MSRGCPLGCCTKPPLIIAADKPSKRLRIRGQTVKKSSISEDFWSTSTCEMDNSIVQSQRSGSSMSTSNLPLDPHKEGLVLWNQTRQQWIGNKRSQNRTQVPKPKLSLKSKSTIDVEFASRRLNVDGKVIKARISNTAAGQESYISNNNLGKHTLSASSKLHATKPCWK